jgi:heptosyltransferase-1
VSRVYQTHINKVIKSSSLVDPYKLDRHDYSIQEIEVEAILTLWGKIKQNLVSKGC